MIEVNAALFTLLVEGFALLSAIAIIGFSLNLLRGGRDRKALRALVATINAEAGARTQRARELLADGDGAAALSKHERGVCQAFISAYDKRASSAVAGVYTQLKALVDGYQAQLEAQRLAVVPPAGTPSPAPHEAVIAKLKQDYEQAAHELQITKQTMDKMLREYNSMFAGGSSSAEPGEEELEAEQLLEMLETRGGDADEAPESTADADEVRSQTA